MSDRKSSSFRQDTNGCPTYHQPSPFPNQRNLKHQPCTSVPASTSELLPISTSRLLPQPLDVPASSTPTIPIPISVQERPRVRRRSEPLTQRVCHSSN
ncbi:hypothetical protein TVAG_451710 [Trichomonas vaginalis G3]|uniref:Uncharacterized protein n=1 Tax=Trichomonas vaginalis (strain ATCC PRA-98 / G3) TaxID=412133 RepID=A2GGN8_TRIV3|nr:hypothetical protein TVAGG3_0921420 [Trichomonas vaginalis G3]EAX83678.1 hypothetical protein TVAG_451710 [Trichomonas vaginalis G3]KAI5485146.1 hypothetical protein TVAGG3_0921420 [Trichomonas vaginalis G3]|eukprot:XP_001296608.1 hypothetical protein [Trichomonas vaginalis G3]